MKPLIKKTFRGNIKINDEVWHRWGNRYGLLTYQPPYVPSNEATTGYEGLEIPAEKEVETEEEKKMIEEEI